ncbi:MAG: DUF1559 family PulG-like putative transporter [Pirellulaceae bacterium]
MKRIGSYAAFLIRKYTSRDTHRAGFAMLQVFHRPVLMSVTRQLISACCLMAMVAPDQYVAGDEPPDVAAVQPFVSETTVCVVKLDSAQIALPDLSEQIKSQSPEVREAWQRLAAVANTKLAWLRTTTGGQVAYASLGIPISSSNAQAVVFCFQKQAPGLTLDVLRERLRLPQPAQACVKGEYLVVAPLQGADVAVNLENAPSVPRRELTPALAAVASYPIQVLLLPPDYLRRTVQELLPQLPPQLGGGPSTLLTDGLSWAALGIDTAHVRAELVIQSASEEAAQKLAADLPRVLQSVCDAYESVPGLQQQISPETIKTLVGLVKPQVSGSRITVHVDGIEQFAETVSLLQMATNSVQQTIRRQSDSHRFKQILIALHNYHQVFRCFPPRQEARDEKGNSKLSWRVHVLPFVDEGALYQEFHLDEAWDSPHNKALLERMPDVYKTGSIETQLGHDIKPGYTTFLAPVGDGTVFGGSKPTSFSDIRDGTSNTVVLVEVQPERAVPWTAPEDFVFDSNAPANGLQIGTDDRFLAAFADGSVQELRGDLTAAQFLQLFQRNDGQPIDWQQIR